jgi:hypothetical protein
MNDMAQFVGNLNLARFMDKLQIEHDPATQASLHGLLFEEWNNLGFNLGQLGSLQHKVIESRARIAIPIAVRLCVPTDRMLGWPKVNLIS